MNIIAKRLKELQAGRTLREFAKIIGVGQSTLHNYLKGRDPKASFIAQVCKKMGCDANWLLGIVATDKNDKQSAIKVSILTMHLEAQIEENRRLLDSLKTHKSECDTCTHKCPHTTDTVVHGCPAYVEAT